MQLLYAALRLADDDGRPGAVQPCAPEGCSGFFRMSPGGCLHFGRQNEVMTRGITRQTDAI